MPKITPRVENDVVKVRTQVKSGATNPNYKWWESDKSQRANQILDVSGFLKEQQQYRYRQAGIYARLYGNMPLFNFVGSSINRMNIGNNLPIDRPTMNIVQSCVDTLVSRITQSRPRPVFLTDNGDYKQRNLAKKLNNFLMGEFYQTDAYKLGVLALRDAAVLGSGCIKVFEKDNRVALERVMLTELLVDQNDSFYGNPRCLYQYKLIDRSVMKDMFPKSSSDIEKAEQAYPDNSGDSERTTSDQIIVVEAWHLPSGEEAGDGHHSIVCSEGVIFDEEYKKDKYPFVFMPYSPRLWGFWGQGLSEQLMGTQVEINKLLVTISRSINLVGVPRVWLEDGSKVVKAHINNDVGMVGTYRGTPPIFMEGTSGIAADIYAQLQRLVDYGYQQAGISQLSSSAQKPAGLNSGEAIRNYDDLQSDRFAALSKNYDNMYVDLAYLVIEQAEEITEREGSYKTVFPNKNSAKEIDLTEADLLDDPVIQCFDSSSLPRDPAGRLQKVTEMMQAGIISPQEGRRLLDYPDIEQVDVLANAAEERILKILDEIIEDGEYTPPDPFMDLLKANELVTQYYNLYTAANLEEEKAEMLRNFFSQVQSLKQEATQPPPGMPPPGAAPVAVPEARPVSPMIPQVPQVGPQ